MPVGDIIIQSAVLILIVILGYVLKKIGLFGKHDYRVLTRLVMYLTLPCVIITSFSKFEWKNSLFLIPVMGLAVNCLLQLWGYMLCRKGSDEDKKFYMLNLPGFSMGTFALPFIQNALGPQGVVAACMFDAGGTVMPSGASYVCTAAILKEKKQPENVNAVFAVKRMLASPPFLTYVSMIALKALRLELPDVLLKFTGKVSDANAFICMIMIGMMFEIRLDKEKLKKAGKLLLTRITVSAAAAALIMAFFPLGEGLKKSLIIVMFSPIATLSLIFTDRMEGDIELAGFANSVSIVLSMVIMTTLMVIMNS